MYGYVRFEPCQKTEKVFWGVRRAAAGRLVPATARRNFLAGLVTFSRRFLWHAPALRAPGDGKTNDAWFGQTVGGPLPEQDDQLGPDFGREKLKRDIIGDLYCVSRDTSSRGAFDAAVQALHSKKKSPPEPCGPAGMGWPYLWLPWSSSLGLGRCGLRLGGGFGRGFAREAFQQFLGGQAGFAGRGQEEHLALGREPVPALGLGQ